MTQPIETTCPYCGELNEVVVEPAGPASESYVEDCSVCCKPWRVTVLRHDGRCSVELAREDE